MGWGFAGRLALPAGLVAIADRALSPVQAAWISGLTVIDRPE
jgi:hypothetical protein